MVQEAKVYVRWCYSCLENKNTASDGNNQAEGSGNCVHTHSTTSLATEGVAGRR